MRGGVLGCPCEGGLFSATGVLPPPPPPQAVSANNAIMANASNSRFMALPFDCGPRERAARRWWVGPARLANLSAPRRARNLRAARPFTGRVKRPRASPTAPRVRTALSHIDSAIDTMPVGLRPAIPNALGAMACLRRAPLDNPPALRAWTRRASGNHHGPRGAVSTSTRRKGAWRATKRVHAPPHCAAALDTAPLHGRACSHVGHAGEHGTCAPRESIRAPIRAPRITRRISVGAGLGIARAPRRVLSPFALGLNGAPPSGARTARATRVENKWERRRARAANSLLLWA